MAGGNVRLMSVRRRTCEACRRNQRRGPQAGLPQSPRGPGFEINLPLGKARRIAVLAAALRPTSRIRREPSAPLGVYHTAAVFRDVDQPGVVACLGRTRTLVRIQPSRLASLVEQRSARCPDVAEVAGSNPAGTIPYSRGPAATAPGSQPGDRRFESCREYCAAEWTGARFPARSHEPSDAGSNPASATRRPSTQTGKAARSRAW